MEKRIKPDVEGRAKGGVARAEALSPTKRTEIAKRAAVARWGAKPLQATHRGNFRDDFGIDVECFVLNDEQKTAVVSRRGMAKALNLGEGGTVLPKFVAGKHISEALGVKLVEKVSNPLVFLGPPLGGSAPSMGAVYGYDVTVLIDICNAIVKAEAESRLTARQGNIAKQAHIILGASAKAGIKGLVYALSGYDAAREEVIAAFKLYVQQEAKKYEAEFPNELYMEWHRLYDIPVPTRGKPWHFKHLTVRHVYYPLAQSNGKIYELLRALKATGGEQKKKLFQFLNDTGARALRMQLGRVLEMAESSKDKHAYEGKITERFGGQRELELVPVSPSTASPPPS